MALRGGTWGSIGGEPEEARQAASSLESGLEVWSEQPQAGFEGYVVAFQPDYSFSKPSLAFPMPGPPRRTKASPMAMSQPGRCSLLAKGLMGTCPSSSLVTLGSALLC